MSFITPLQIIAGAPGPAGPAGPQGPEGPAGVGADEDILAGKTPKSGIPVDATGARLITLSYDEVARQVTITPTGAEWEAFVDGVLYTFTGAQSVIHDAVHGGHFIYVDNTGTIVSSQVPWDLAQTAPLVFVFWDNTGAAGIPFYEWHHAGRDVWLHTRLHAIDGTQTGPGFAISGYTLNDGTVDSALSFAVAEGLIIDEDIFTDSDALADGGPYTILERSGASGNWLISRGNTLPIFHAANVLQYNEFTGATWQRTNVPEDEFVNYWVFAAPALVGWDQIVVIPGQVTYATEVEAHGEVPASLSWGSIPFQEIAPLYQVTLRYNAVAPSAYTNTPRAAIVRLVRVVGSRAILSSVAQSDHGALAGLLDDDHLQYHNDARGDARYDIRYLDIAAAVALLPAGGTAGQLLAKVDADDYDTTWIDPPAGGGSGDPIWTLIETIDEAGGSGFKGVDIALDFATYRRIRIFGSYIPITTNGGAQWLITDTVGELSAGYQHRIDRMLLATTSFSGTGSSGTPQAVGTLAFTSDLTLPFFFDIVLEKTYSNGDATFTQRFQGHYTEGDELAFVFAANKTLTSIATEIRLQVGTVNQNWTDVHFLVMGEL